MLIINSNRSKIKKKAMYIALNTKHKEKYGKLSNKKMKCLYLIKQSLGIINFISRIFFKKNMRLILK